MTDRLRWLATKGDSASEIAVIMTREFDVVFTRNSIIGKMMRAEIVSANARKPNLEWTEARLNKLRVLASQGVSAADIARELKFWTAKAIRVKCRAERIKLKAHRGAAKKRPKVVAPSIMADDVPFLPPVELVVEYMPAARAPETFLAVGPFKCRQFLPDQDQKPAPDRLVCANPIEPGSRRWFCAACSERFPAPVSADPLEDDAPEFNAARKRSTLTGAVL
ncbi:hypothetical protein [Kaistia nematophila]|uniref:GcrA cell cycle regulator n=1 Tax=Kaistia nematophila TaxID=2994654 RepID=A0A9X3E119_9HYPH|nr:hypothetical protein [Kaistia nematophila]MCX5569625.1 hypothetical protein [Kaistia nematophila]